MLDLGELSLTRDGTLVRLRPQAVRVLGALIERAGRLVTREELRQAIWGDDTFVDFNLGLNVAIKQVREAIGDDADRPRFIETVPRFGYRFVAPVEPVTFARDAGVEAGAAEPSPPPPALESRGPALPVSGAADLPATSVQAYAGARRRGSSQLLAFVGGLLTAALAVALVYVAWWASRGMSAAPTAAPPTTSVAVLPFDVGALPDAQAHLSMTLADALITRLGRSRGVAALPTSAIDGLRNAAGKSPVARGRQLGADVVVEGRVRAEGTGVSVTLQAVRVRDGALVWAGEFHDSPMAIAQSAGAMAAQLVHAIGAGPAPRVESAPTRNPEAYEAYLRGRHLWNRRDTSSMTAAIALYRRALDLDPGFALAHVGIANVHAFRATPEEAERNLTEALKIDPTLPEAQATLGFLRMFHYWDWKGAEQAFLQALSGNPGYATAHHWYGVFLMLNRRFDEAIASLEQAKALEPVSAPILSDLGLAHQLAGDYARAAELCTQALQMEPGMLFARECLTRVYEEQGKDFLAVESTYGRTSPLMDVLARHGYRGVVERALSELLTHQRDGWHYQAAELYAQLGQDDLALASLSASVQQHEFLVPFANVSRRFERLRGTLAFQDMMRRIGLAPGGQV